jgi:hypothetical protein
MHSCSGCRTTGFVVMLLLLLLEPRQALDIVVQPAACPEPSVLLAI